MSRDYLFFSTDSLRETVEDQRESEAPLRLYSSTVLLFGRGSLL
jgi:hypothetical protein